MRVWLMVIFVLVVGVPSAQSKQPQVEIVKMPAQIGRQEKEQAEYFDFLTQEGTSPLGSRFTHQEAVILPGKEFK